MLPSCITYRKFFFVTFSLIIVFTSCSDISETDLAVIRELNESIENTNKSIARNTEDILTSLRDKMSDPGTASIAGRVYPKAKRIQSLSKEAFDFVETIKAEIEKTSVSKVFQSIGFHLYDTLMDYKSKLFEIDSGIVYEFQKSIIVFSHSFDSIGKSQGDLFDYFFKKPSPVFARAILSKFQNNIRINEERMIAFCNESMAIDVVIRDYNATWPFVTQSSTIVEAADQIEIAAGIASFNRIQNPQVFIYEKLVSTNEGGVSVYKLKAASKPGKYYVPVKINYTDQDGRRITVKREIEYTVANIQQQ